MYSPITIANYFLNEYKDVGITPMKLVKLVYISHGWHLGITGKVLIDENPEAWKYGPVIPTIYHKFKLYGGREIIGCVNAITETIDNEVKELLNTIWKVYGMYSAVELSAMTHEVGTPWYITWHGTNRWAHMQIPEKLIKEHYAEKLENNKKEA